MAVFEYQARTKDGNIQTGSVEAASEAAALEILQKHDLIIVSIGSIEEEPFYMRQLKIFNRVSGKDLAVFSRQLATLFRASVPIVNSLETLSNQTQNTTLQKAISDIAADVDGGTSLDAALAKYPDIFNNFYVQIIKAGTESGTLDDVLLYLAEYTEREYRIIAKVKSSMTYPAFVMSVFLIVVSVMLIWILPNLISIIEGGGAELPLITRIISGISTFLRESWAWVLVFLVAGVVGMYRFLKSASGKLFWDRWQLRLPVFGPIFKNIHLFRFSESLGLLIRGGVPINASLKITADVVGNSVYKQIINEAREKVNKGERIAEALSAYPETSGMISQMISVGEKTGKLEEILKTVAKFYEEEVSNSVEGLVALIEPVLIVFLGIGVGLLMAGILLPIYTSVLSAQ